MPEVAFHSGVADKAAYLYRLLRKAYRQGSRVRVVGEPAQLDRLDSFLWAAEQGEFIPHARLRRGQAPDAALAAVTPIWLADAGAGVPPCEVLVNLGVQADAEEAGHARVIEIVGVDDEDRQRARQRWRHYEQLQWPLQHHRIGSTDER